MIRVFNFVGVKQALTGLAWQGQRCVFASPTTANFHFVNLCQCLIEDTDGVVFLRMVSLHVSFQLVFCVFSMCVFLMYVPPFSLYIFLCNVFLLRVVCVHGFQDQ